MSRLHRSFERNEDERHKRKLTFLKRTLTMKFNDSKDTISNESSSSDEDENLTES